MTPADRAIIVSGLINRRAEMTRADLAVIVSALQDAAEYRRDQGNHCRDCAMTEGGKCEDHASDDERAAEYDRVAGVAERELARG